MAFETTYSSLRANLADVMDEVTQNREVVIVKRKGRDDVAMISAFELSGLLETAHLLRSPANAKRLLSALKKATAGKGRRVPVAQLKSELGLAAN